MPQPKKEHRKNTETGEKEWRFIGDTLWQDGSGNVILC